METLSDQRNIEILAYNVEITVRETVREELGESRGWRMCGPVSIALAHTLNMFTGIPIQRGGEEEHFQLHIGIYGFGPSTDEHTYLLHKSGKRITYIDAVSRLLWGNVTADGGQSLDLQLPPDPNFALITRVYNADEIDEQLWFNHGIHPFDPKWGFDVWGNDGRPSTYRDWEDMEIAMNDGSILEGGRLLCASGAIREPGDWTDGTRRAIQSIASHYGLHSRL